MNGISNHIQRINFSLLFLSVWLYGFPVFCQEGAEADVSETRVIDSLYREDQFYTGITFNLLLNSPINQSGFSGGLHLGYIRDMPVNKRRNVAIGLGLGYSINTFAQNLFIGEEEANERSIFVNLENANITYNSNRFITHLVEAPLEFRWRTSVPETHKFWRIYTGLRVGYLYRFRSTFENNDNIKIIQTKVNELNRWRVGATFALGWNTFNFYFYYSLNSFFGDEALVDEQRIGMSTAKFGLMFYIL